MITISNLRDRFPEFSSETEYPDSVVQMYINKAVGELDEGQWGGQYDEGLLNYTAHFLSLYGTMKNSGGISGSLGPVASRSIGDVSISFGGVGSSSTHSEFFFSITPYGQEYWRLVMLYGVSILAV